VILERATFIGTVAVLSFFLTSSSSRTATAAGHGPCRSREPRQAETLTASAADGLARVGSFVRRTAALAAIDAIVAGCCSWPGRAARGAWWRSCSAGFVPYLGAIVATAAAASRCSLAGPAAAVVLVGGLALAAVAETRLLAGTRIANGATSTRCWS
jgi:hypothetical protein